MEPDFSKFEKEILRAAIKAEDEAIDTRRLNIDKSWEKISGQLDLKPKKRSFFEKFTQFLSLEWGISYGAQTSALTFSFLVIGIFAGVGIDSHLIQDNRGIEYDTVRGGVSKEKLTEQSFVRLQKSSNDPQGYIKDLTSMSLNLGLPVLLRKINSEYEIEIYNLVSNDTSQVPIKVFLELPSSFDGTVKIFLTKK
jgi:hypothetical protein